MDLLVTSALARSVTAVFERVSVKLENWNFASMCVSVAAFRKHSLKVKGQVSRWGQGRKTAKKWQFWTLSCPGISEHGNLFAVRSPKCAPTCALSIETPLDPVRCCWAELPNRNQMSDCQKMTVKKILIGQKIFLCHNFYYLGKSDTENSNFASMCGPMLGL